MNEVLCRLSHILIDEQREHIVFLAERDGERKLSFLIGQVEAAAIDRNIREQKFARPLTHDLTLGIVQALGARFLAVHVTHSDQSTYFAELELETAEGELRRIDCRPSDGLALLALRPEADLFVAEDLLD